MKFKQIHDKLTPWRLAAARKAALVPLESVSAYFRTYLKTFWDVLDPQGRDGEKKK